MTINKVKKISYIFICIIFIATFIIIKSANAEEPEGTTGGTPTQHTTTLPADAASTTPKSLPGEGIFKQIQSIAYGDNAPTEKGRLENIVGTIINIALSFVGALFVILIIYGGILWMTAGGKEEQVTKGRKYLINATIGLIIVILANIITALVINILKPAPPPADQSTQTTPPSK